MRNLLMIIFVSLCVCAVARGPQVTVNVADGETTGSADIGIAQGPLRMLHVTAVDASGTPTHTVAIRDEDDATVDVTGNINDNTAAWIEMSDFASWTGDVMPIDSGSGTDSWSILITTSIAASGDEDDYTCTLYFD